MSIFLRVVQGLAVSMIYSGVTVVRSHCIKQQYCIDLVDIMDSIKADPDNYQQLINAFYPINRAKPSTVIIAYFINYTDPLPQECEQGTYPWRTQPRTNLPIHWYLSTTTQIFTVSNEMVMMEIGEYLPTTSYYIAFNKSSPFYLPTRISCVRVPYYLGESNNIVRDILKDITIQVRILLQCLSILYNIL
jgi:hypothetical protein